MDRTRFGISSPLRFVITATFTLALIVSWPARAAAQSCGGSGQPMCGTVITPPASALERPDRLYVLPVMWFPSDVAPSTEDLNRAATNLVVHTRMAQVKYRAMLRHPYTGADRGTFAVATWDFLDTPARIRVFQDGVNGLVPLIVRSTRTQASLSSDQNTRDMATLAEILDATGCKMASCPFVFVIINGHETSGGDQSALTMNYGLNGGAAFVRLPFSVARDADGHADWHGNSVKPGVPAAAEATFQSTLIHELGHAFGLWHTETMYPNLTYDYPRPPKASFHNLAPRGFCQSRANPDADCVTDYTTYCNGMSSAERRLAMYCSPSIMSYAIFNQVYGCSAKDANGYCAMPASVAAIEQEAGALLTEDVNLLSKNELAFPELAASFDELSENPGGLPLKYQRGDDIPDRGAPYIVPGHESMKVSSNDGDPIFQDTRIRWQPEPRMSIGHYTKTIPPRGAPWNHLSMWRTVASSGSFWAEVNFSFPEAVNITRVRVFTGYENGIGVATMAAIDAIDVGGSLIRCLPAVPIAGGGSNGEVPLVNGEGEATCQASIGAHRRYRVSLLKPATVSGRVVVRGIRLYASRQISPGVFEEYELEGPREPIASSSDGATNEWAGSPQLVVGGNQVIEPYSAPFDPQTMWHSKYVGPGNWASIEIRLPEMAAIRAITAYTGHSGQYNPAAEVLWESKGPHGAYVWRMQDSTGAPAALLMSSPPVNLTHVRISFRAGPSGWITVRGIRFFTDLGELFQARSVGDPVATVGYSPSFVYEDNAIAFTAQSSDPETLFAWDFGDGMTAGGSHVTHTYATSGARTVQVTARLFCNRGFDMLCHSTTQSFAVNINADTTAPNLENLTQVTERLEGNERGGRRVTYRVPVAVDDVGGVIDPVCVPAPGSLFVVGLTTVNCTATDASGNASSTFFRVDIVDTTPPTIAPKADIDAPQDDPNGAIVNYQPPQTLDVVDGDGSAICSPASGSTFTFGQTTVTCNADDHAGNHAVPVTFKVKVPLAPVILGTSGASSPPVFTKAHYQFSTQATTPGIVELVEWSCGAGVVSGGPSLTMDVPPRRDFAILCTFSQVGATAVTMKFRGGNGVTRLAEIPVTPTPDTTGPELTVADVTVTGSDPAVAGSTATFSPLAMDNIAVDRVECLPVSGSLFPFGSTQVSCTAFDTSNNPSEAKTFTVKVLDGVAPVLQQPADITLTGSDPAIAGAAVTFSPIATDNLPGATVQCSPLSGTTFPFGTTPVSCTAIDAANNRSEPKTFTVTVLDGVKPAVTVPANITLTGSDPAIAGAGVTFSPVATDNLPGATVECSPLSGTTFPFGTTPVTCTAIDAASNRSEPKTFTVTVLDGVAPTFAVPANITLTGSNPAVAGAVAMFSPVAADNLPGATVECSPLSGTMFPFGTTSVSCTAIDAANNRSEPKTFTVTVLDGVAPVVTVPVNITREATGVNGAAVTFTATATDNVSGALTPACSPQSGSTFPVGATTVTCTATDGRNTGSASFTVTITNVTTPGEMRGDGFVRDDGAKYMFEFLARELASGAERARLSIRIDEDGRRKAKKGKKRDDRFESRSVDDIVFSDDPGIRPGRQRRPQVDTVLFRGVGEWNGTGGYRYEVFAQDEGEPGRHRESIRVKIWNSAGQLVASFEGELDGGNIQSGRIRH